MSFVKLTLSDFLEQVLPDFIVEEFPTFIKFFREYYKSLEIKGGVLDVSQNILEYKDFDSLKKFNLVSSAKLNGSINATATSIRLDSIKGFEKKNGIIKIDNEIIFYQDVNTTTNTLLNCKRGYSGTTLLKEIGTEVKSTTAATHANNAVVTNLSNLFLFSILKNYEEQYLEGFPYKQLDSDIDVVTLLKNIKDFYSFKGTSTSVEFLFRSIYDEEILIKYPKDYLIKSSYSDWTVDDIIKVEAISGDPYDLVGNEIKQTDAAGASNVTAIVDTILVNNISNYASGNKNIYEIRLNILNRDNFKVPQETILRRPINQTDSVIIVDSTIGFPEENGVIQIDNEIITYRYKSFNQFFDCTRGSYSTARASHVNESFVRTTEYLYGYKGGIVDPRNLITLRLIGVLASTTINDGASYYNEEEGLSTSLDGVVDDRKQFTTWRLNEDGNVSNSSNVEINNIVKNITTEVSAVYKTKNFAYISSTGLPNHPIGSFVGAGVNVGNQFLLKAIPLKSEKITQVQPVGDRAVGLFVNGVEAYSCKDLESENFGGIDSVEIIQNGYGFEDNIQPVFRIKNATGAGATFSASVSNGRISSVKVLSPGNNYTTDSDLEIAYGFDATAVVLNDTDLVRGSIKTITVVSGGTNYIIPPLVEITDITGKGRGAYAVATISGGTVTGINVLSGGIDYTERNNIRITLISKGTAVIAKAKVKRWNYNRVFRLLNLQNSLGNWVPTQNTKLDASNGYLFPSADVRYGLQYAYSFNPKILRSTLNDNVKDVSFNYEEVNSGFAHSPILGWAYDGTPIYGPYGYSNAFNTSSSIKRMESSYRLITTVPSDRPNTTKYPLGAFIQDYEYLIGAGDLDANNGRFCKTPEYPNGIYAYFITVDSFGKGVFPYIIGKTYNAIPSQINFSISNNQVETNLPSDARRLKTAKTPSKGFDARLLVNSVQRGVVDNFVVYSSNNTFKVGDFLSIDSTNTEGAGAFGTVESVVGVTVSSVTYAVASGYTASGITITSGRTQFPFPTRITAPGYTIPYELYIKTSTPHLLANNDTVTLNLDINTLQTTKTYKVRVGTYQTVKYIPPSVTTTLDADVAFNQTNINVISAAQFKNNDYISINDEILRIVSINFINNQLTVLRAQLGTPLRLHSATNQVKLYIPPTDQKYRIAVGDAINSAGVVGTIYSIDKANDSFEVRIISGTLTSSSVINDASTPTARQISVVSVTPKATYWEIDPSNTGNYYIRDLSFDLVRGTRYIFDVSDSSNSGYNLWFSEDFSNINQIQNIAITGTAGTPGAFITLSEDILKDTNISRVYYYEQNNKILNNKSFFAVKNYFEGLYSIKIVDNSTFKINFESQPEKDLYSNVSYSTTSLSTTGSIFKIKTNDGGEGYKKLPLLKGIVHSDIDNAKFAYSLSGGSISDSVSVLSQGNRYSQKTVLEVVSSTGTGAVLIPSIVNGKIVSVLVVNGGRNYSLNDKIIAIDTDVVCYAESSTIGKIKSIRFANYGTQFNVDRTLAKQLIFNYKVIVTNVNDDEGYKTSEIINTSNGATAQIIKIQLLGNKSYLLDLKLISGVLLKDTVLTGNIKQTTSFITQVRYPEVFGNISGYVKRVGFYDSDLGKLNSSSQKITDSFYYQDFSYVIRSTRSLKEYRAKVDKSTHPLGFKLFGEVAVEGGGIITNSGITGNGSVTLPRDYRDGTVVIIPASGIKVESQLNYRRYELQTINTRNPAKIPGEGAALLNFLDNQIEAVKISNISTSFSGGSNVYALSTQDGNFPSETKNTSIILAINEIFQEPVERKNITSISYANNIATITTADNHGYAYTTSGITYPVDLYTTIEGITFSGVGINLNDRFEIYSVNTANTFAVLFNNLNPVASGTVPPNNLTNAKVVKGSYEYSANNLKLYENPKPGSTFYSTFYKFLNGSDDSRYSYKVKNILFDGVSKEFDLYKLDGSNLITEPDENLLIFIDGVLQIYEETYTINRSVNPNKIVFKEVYERDRNFFAYTFSKYKVLNDISSNFNNTNKSFDLVFQTDNIKLPDVHQLLVLLDGVPQKEGDNYTINDNILIFNEAPAEGKKCRLIYFYGKTFDKTISIWNGKVFERLQDIGSTTPDGCKYFNRVSNTYEYIKPGDQISIDGETPKELISLETNVLTNSDNYQYTAFVFTDNSYIRGKNAVATAVLSGIPTPEANQVSISGVVTMSGIVGIPTVFNNKVISVTVDNPGYEYDVPPIVLFKTACDNPGRGAEAYANVKNGRVTSVVVTNNGSGYTEAPDVVFAKRYEIIKQKYPIYDFKEIVVDTRLNDGIAMHTSPGLSAHVAIGSEEKYEIPIVMTQISSTKQIVAEIEHKTNLDPSKPALSYVLQNLDNNKFTYEPLELTANPNGPEAPYLYQGMTLEFFSRYFPNLTIGDFTSRLGATTGVNEPNIMNIAQDGYVTFGLTLASGITDLDQTILVSGSTNHFPPSGYIEFGNELISYASISGVTLLNCQRGVLNTTASGHSAGDYIRLAWRG